MARLNKKLNLVFPLVLEDGQTAYAHSMPVSREVFETHFMVMSQAFAAIYTGGLSHVVGPRVAMMMLRRCATNIDQSTEVEQGLIAEMRRLTNVLLPSPQGYSSIMYDEALRNDLLDADTIVELENALAFFTLVSAIRGQRSPGALSSLEGMAALWETQTTPLQLMEFSASLPTSTETEIFLTPAASSVPS